MKTLLVTLLVWCGILAAVVGVGSWMTPDVKVVHWEGETDEDFLKLVRSDVEAAQAEGVKTLRVYLMSPGGSVVIFPEAARLIRAASDAGMVVEIHGRGIIASGGTFLLAAGTPGHRYITRETFVLVHGIQFRGGCQSFVPDAKTENEKAINAFLAILRDQYMRLTDQPSPVAEQWLTCGEEQAGDGRLAIDLGLADHLE